MQTTLFAAACCKILRKLIDYIVELLDIFDRGMRYGSIKEIQAQVLNEDSQKIFTMITCDIDMSSGNLCEKTLKTAGEYPDRPQIRKLDRYQVVFA